MRTFERLAYLVVIALAFGCGLVAVWVAPPDVAQADALLPRDPLLTATIAGVCMFASGATAYIMAYSLRCQPQWLLILVKLFYVSLPAVGTGVMLGVLLGSLGLIRLPYSSTFLCLISASDISAGVAGIAAMKSIPEYVAIFPRWRRNDPRTTKGSGSR